MRFIRKLSYKGADYLAKHMNENNEQRRVYYFGLQVIIGETVKYTLFFFLIYILGIFTQALTALLFFSVIRIIAGGYHMKNYTSCMITSFAIIIGAGFALKYANLPMLVLIIISVITSVLSLCVAFKWAPCPAFPKDLDIMKRIKYLTIAIIIVWSIANFCFLYIDNKFLAQAGCSGILLADFALSPISAKIFDPIDRKISC